MAKIKHYIPSDIFWHRKITFFLEQSPQKCEDNRANLAPQILAHLWEGTKSWYEKPFHILWNIMNWSCLSKSTCLKAPLIRVLQLFLCRQQTRRKFHLCWSSPVGLVHDAPFSNLNRHMLGSCYKLECLTNAIFKWKCWGTPKRDKTSVRTLKDATTNAC